MKIIVSGIFALGVIAILAIGGLNFLSSAHASPDAGEFLRLHIRANSDSVEDQRVKFAVQQKVINEFTPIFANVTSREQAMNVLSNNLARFESIANQTLRQHGFTYSARVFLRAEEFPARSYHGFNLPAGTYDALIIELGAAAGANWFCVVYPPLCFLDNNIGGDRGVVYRSRLNEIIRRFF